MKEFEFENILSKDQLHAHIPAREQVPLDREHSAGYPCLPEIVLLDTDETKSPAENTKEEGRNMVGHTYKDLDKKQQRQMYSSRPRLLRHPRSYLARPLHDDARPLGRGKPSAPQGHSSATSPSIIMASPA